MKKNSIKNRLRNGTISDFTCKQILLFYFIIFYYYLTSTSTTITTVTTTVTTLTTITSNSPICSRLPGVCHSWGLDVLNLNRINKVIFVADDQAERLLGTCISK